jgi:hypothetical protein
MKRALAIDPDNALARELEEKWQDAPSAPGWGARLRALLSRVR